MVCSAASFRRCSVISFANTVKAVTLFGETYPDVDLVALVDFDNDSVGTSLAVAPRKGTRPVRRWKSDSDPIKAVTRPRVRRPSSTW